MEAVWYALTPEMINDSNFAGLPQSGYIRLPAVLALIPVSKSTWWAGVRDGRFPRPTKKFGPRIAAWDNKDINLLLERGVA
jgi:prophage regulatory protein